MDLKKLNKQVESKITKMAAEGKYKGHTYKIKTKGKDSFVRYKAVIDGDGGPETEWHDEATKAGQEARKLIDAFDSEMSYKNLASKKQPKGDIRSAFYKASDGIYSLKDVVSSEQDAQLKSKAQALMTALNQLESYLSQNYSWD